MKSAYDLAMERLQQQAPTVKLTEEQKAQIAEIDSLYKSRVAEREVFLQDQLAKASAAGQFDQVEQIQQELSRDLRRLNEECESKKEKVRRGEKA
jgi:hypothetical protein